MSDIILAMRLGDEIHVAGAVFYVLRRKDIPKELRRRPEVRRAEGTTVVKEGALITTVYKNRDIRHLRRKQKRGRVKPSRQTNGRSATQPVASTRYAMNKEG